MSESKFYKLELQFNGANYYGWQIQPGKKTLQGELNRALAEIFKSDRIKSIGSGRTDTGVHSRCHIVKVEVPFEIEKIALLKGLNSILPKDILVKKVEGTEKEFMPTSDAKSKEYFYLFSNQDYPEVMLLNQLPNVTFNLDFDLMCKACKQFEGTYDFKSFMCTGSDPKTTVRTIYSCTIEKVNEPSFHALVPAHYKITVKGNGFLKQMIRLIVGAIWQAGQGKISSDQIRMELENPSGRKLGATAPAAGLYKAKVSY